MTLKALFFTIIFILVSAHIKSQGEDKDKNIKSTGIKNILIKTAPELIIQKITFHDENFNKHIDADESFYFELTIGNSGKTAAIKPLIEISVSDTLDSNLIFDKNIFLDQINVGDIRIIKIKIKADKTIKNGTAHFQFTVSDSLKYASVKKYDIKMQEKEVFLATEWYYPTNLNMVSEKSIVEFRLCIKSKSPLKELKVFQNKELIQTIKEFKHTGNKVCPYLIEKKINLKIGSNELKVIVENDGNIITSEKRVIIFKPDFTEYRNALVIGNSNYIISPLRNPKNDAKEIAKALRKLNFDVIELINADKKTMRDSIRSFKNKMQKDKGVGLFYYAGHGVQVQGENYLIPVNHDIQEEYDVEDEAIRVNSVLRYMQDSESRMNIIILDACRDNPFASSTRSGVRGLASIYASGSGSLIAYATSPGSTAADGDGKNGLYTQELLKAMKTPGVEIGMFFRKVLENVKKQSNGSQIPWTSSSIIGEFYFKK